MGSWLRLKLRLNDANRDDANEAGKDAAPDEDPLANDGGGSLAVLNPPLVANAFKMPDETTGLGTAAEEPMGVASMLVADGNMVMEEARVNGVSMGT